MPLCICASGSIYVHACIHHLSMEDLGSFYFLAIANSTAVSMELNLLSLYLNLSYFVHMVCLLFSFKSKRGKAS